MHFLQLSQKSVSNLAVVTTYRFLNLGADFVAGKSIETPAVSYE